MRADNPGPWNAWLLDDLFSHRGKKKKEKKRQKEKSEGRNTIEKKALFHPTCLEGCQRFSSSFWAEARPTAPGARRSSIPTAMRWQASLGSLYWGYSALHYIKKRRLGDINGKCGIVTAVKPLLCPPFFLCLARGAEGLGIKVLLKSWDRDKARER